MFVHFTSCTYQPGLPFGPVTSCPSHVALLKAAAKIPLGPIVDEQPPTKDIFDNPFIPTTTIPYLPHDFCKLDSTGSHEDGCSGPDPSVWRVVTDEKFTFVFPRELGRFVESDSPVSKPKLAYTFRFSYRPTLDEFMSSRDQYRDSNVFVHRGAALGTQVQSRPTNTRQPSSKPTASVVAKENASLPIASQDDDMVVDSHADAAALRSSNPILSPQSSPYYGDEDTSDDDEDNDDDNFELPVTKRKARKPLKKLTKKQDLRPTVTSRPALRESINEQSRKVYFACPFDECERVCSTRGDLERHLETKDHKQPSVPCPRGCGIVFTRRDAAKRHAKQGSCGGKKTKKPGVKPRPKCQPALEQ